MAALTGVDLDRVDTSAQFALGTIYYDYTGKIYKYITYSEEAAAVDGVAGEVAYYVAATGYANNDVTSDLSASDEVGAGVLQATLSDNEFGWIQIKGPATLTIALTAGADGDTLTPTGAGDGTLDVTALVTDHRCAVAGDISAQEILCDFPF
ncbi:MAG: hypothetical protein GWN00_19730 [Aliifodinibius sp.]|nr:hypothetical protein [Fodinibius sp.]NIY26953.1 hypothetical protein [Fodinibius sp.]